MIDDGGRLLRQCGAVASDMGDTEVAPWYVVDANVKRHARLNVTSHLLSQIPCKDLTRKKLKLPKRQPAGDYEPPADDQFRWIPERCS